MLALVSGRADSGLKCRSFGGLEHLGTLLTFPSAAFCSIYERADQSNQVTSTDDGAYQVVPRKDQDEGSSPKGQRNHNARSEPPVRSLDVCVDDSLLQVNSMRGLSFSHGKNSLSRTRDSIVVTDQDIGRRQRPAIDRLDVGLDYLAPLLLVYPSDILLARQARWILRTFLRRQRPWMVSAPIVL